nr:DUF2523 family protein [Neisseria subflava]
MNWASLITGVLMSVAGRILTAVGLSFISVTGLNTLQSYFINEISRSIGGFPDEALQILYIAGFGVILNWIFGAFSFVISLKGFKKLSTIIQSK